MTGVGRERSAMTVWEVRAPVTHSVYMCIPEVDALVTSLVSSTVFCGVDNLGNTGILS
jgi:hypothetical protein